MDRQANQDILNNNYVGQFQGCDLTRALSPNCVLLPPNFLSYNQFMPDTEVGSLLMIY